jgi:hypothetical protein
LRLKQVVSFFGREGADQYTGLIQGNIGAARMCQYSLNSGTSGLPPPYIHDFYEIEFVQNQPGFGTSPNKENFL